MVASSIGQRLVSSVSLLTPFLGSDLQILVENTVCPHNARSYSGIDIYGNPLYREPCTNIRVKQVSCALGEEISDGTKPAVRGVCVGASRHMYYTFAAVNEHNMCKASRNRPSSGMTPTSSIPSNSAGSPVFTGEQQMQQGVEHILQASYSGSIIRIMCKTLLENGKFMCCATMMATITVPLLSTPSSSSKNVTTSWVQKCLFNTYSRPAPVMLKRKRNGHDRREPLEETLNEENDVPIFKQSILYQILRALGFATQTELSPGTPPHSAFNKTFSTLMSRYYQEFQLRKKCETEMFVSYSRNSEDGGCLVAAPCFSGKDALTPSSSSLRAKAGRQARSDSVDSVLTEDVCVHSSPREDISHHTAASTVAETVAGADDPPRPSQHPFSRVQPMTFTAVPSHGRASSKFSTPSFRHGKRVSTEELLKGLAAAAWMAGAIDVIVVSRNNINAMYSYSCVFTNISIIFLCALLYLVSVVSGSHAFEGGCGDRMSSLCCGGATPSNSYRLLSGKHE